MGAGILYVLMPILIRTFCLMTGTWLVEMLWPGSVTGGEAGSAAAQILVPILAAALSIPVLAVMYEKKNRQGGNRKHHEYHRNL